MRLHLQLALSLSLLSTILLATPAFADDAPAPAPLAAPLAPPPPAYAAPAHAQPGYSVSPAPVGPPMYARYAQQPPIVETHRASPGMIVGGSVLTFLGVGGVAGGTLFYVIERGILCEAPDCKRSGAMGVVGMVVGSLAMIGGVSMIVLGARKETTSLPEASLQIRPTGADLRVTF